jgi:hypothetical protein
MRPGQKQQVLSQLAYVMTISRVQKLSGKRAAAAIRVPLATASATVDPQEFLANARASGLLLLERDNVVAGGAPGLLELGITPTPVELVVPSLLQRFRPGGGRRDILAPG